MGICLAPLKCILFVINIIFAIVGAFLLYAGVKYLDTDYGSLSHENLWPAVVIFASAGVLIFGSIIGCVGTIIEKKACLGVFLFLLVAVLLIELCVGGVMLSQRSASQDKLTSFVLDQFQRYGNFSDADFNATSFIDELQKDGQCCGYNNYTDWMNETWFFDHNRVPLSCCDTSVVSSNCTGNITQPELLYTEGCKNTVNDVFRFVYDLLAWGAIAIGIFLFVGTLIVIGLLYRQRNRPLGYSELSPGYTEA